MNAITSTLENSGNFNSAGASESKPRSFGREFDLDQWKSGNESALKTRRKRRKAVPAQELTEFTSQLAIMVKSQIDVATALESLAAQAQQSALAAVLDDVHRSVLAGSTLSEAFRKHETVFDATFVATLAAGEASGSLAGVLGQLAAMQRNELRVRRTLRTLLTYPILLLVVSLSVITALVVFVLPKFSEIFEQYDVVLPLITATLIAVADEIKVRWWFWLPLVATFVMAGWLWRQSALGRRTLDRFWVHAAIIRNVTRARLTGRFCGLLGMMLHSGVPLLETLQLTKRATQNSLYRQLIDELEEAVVNGRTMTSVLKGADMLPRSARDMLITAEETANIAEVGRLLGEYYEEEAEAHMRRLVGLIEPILTLAMGVLVAIVVLAVMLPIFDLSSVAKGG